MTPMRLRQLLPYTWATCRNSVGTPIDSQNGQDTKRLFSMPFPNYLDIFSYVLCLPHFVTAKSGNLESEAPFLLSSHLAQIEGCISTAMSPKPQESLCPMGFFGFAVCTCVSERFVKKPHRARSLRWQFLAFRSSAPRSTRTDENSPCVRLFQHAFWMFCNQTIYQR